MSVREVFHHRNPSPTDEYHVIQSFQTATEWTLRWDCFVNYVTKILDQKETQNNHRETQKAFHFASMLLGHVTSGSGTRSWPACRWAAVKQRAPCGPGHSGISVSGSLSPASTAAGRWTPSELCEVSSGGPPQGPRPRPALRDWQVEMTSHQSCQVIDQEVSLLFLISECLHEEK